VIQRGRTFEIPWDERPAPERHAARITALRGTSLARAFGAPVTPGAAVVHRGRAHICGAARSI
jgi:hypothetical protein